MLFRLSFVILLLFKHLANVKHIAWTGLSLVWISIIFINFELLSLAFPVRNGLDFSGSHSDLLETMCSLLADCMNRLTEC